jgi:hypothetical protein
VRPNSLTYSGLQAISTSLVCIEAVLDLTDTLADVHCADFAIECVGELIDVELSSGIADLWVQDMEDLSDGKCYPLVSAASNRWEVQGAIEV